MGAVWNRLARNCDAHGMCTLERLVTPDAFCRREIARTFATLLGMHKRNLVHLSQEQPYGPIVIERLQEDQETPELPFPDEL
uniref:Rad21/Rec8-like protein C-terminal eukaryotic domain-containing protein n=1 Tax=Ixodes ricinus TaxID=34613 RepID=A0A147BJG8_IXORI